MIRVLKRTGFYVHHTTGSHYVLKHPRNDRVRVSIACHNRDLKRRTLESIIEQSGLTREEFLDSM